MTFARKLYKLIHKSNLKSDIIAGVTVALLLIPQSLAYAKLAGLPPQFGLFAALLPPIIATYFGSSPQLSTGPIAVLSLMTFSALTPLAEPGTSLYNSYAIALALMLGVFLLLLGLLRLGNLVSLLSHPVIYGFTNAAAVIIGTTQIASFFGVSVGRHEHHYQMVSEALQKGFQSPDLTTLILGVSILLMMFLMKKINSSAPAVLIALVVGTIITRLFELPVAIIGNIPIGIGSINIPDFEISQISLLGPAVVAMGMIGFTETVAISQAIAIKTKSRFDPNRELIGQGAANLIGSFNSSYPVSGSLARTALNYRVGATSWRASLVTSFTVLVVLLFFTKYLYHLPQVVLAAIIVYSVAGLIDFKKIQLLWNINRFDTYASLLTFFSTLYFAPELEKGVFLGAGISMIYFIYRNTHPRVAFLSLYKDKFFHDAHSNHLDVCTNIALVRLDAPLFFANATFFEEEVIKYLATHKKVTDVLFIGSGINEIDITGEEILENLTKALNENNKHVFFASMKRPVMDKLYKSGFVDEIGEEQFFSTAKEAVKHLLKHLEHEHKHLDHDNCPLMKYTQNNRHHEHHESSRRNHIAFVYEKMFGKK